MNASPNPNKSCDNLNRVDILDSPNYELQVSNILQNDGNDSLEHDDYDNGLLNQQIDDTDITANIIHNNDPVIPQFDGPNDDTGLDLYSSSCQTSLPLNVIAAPYTQEKQLSRLGRNATLAPFTMDTTSATNIIIQCSPGFYQLVAKPTCP